MANTDQTITVNGTPYPKPADPDLTVREWLHDDLNLTGTKICCGVAACKVCTFATRSANGSYDTALGCVTTIGNLEEGISLTTVEGVADGATLHPLQIALLENYSFQCGYCTPGFLMAAWVLWQQLSQNPCAKGDLDGRITQAIGDHICRCTGYVRYVDAIRAAILANPGLTT